MPKVKTVEARDVGVGDILAFHGSMNALSDVTVIFADDDGVTFVSGDGARWMWELPARAVVTILDLD